MAKVKVSELVTRSPIELFCTAKDTNFFIFTVARMVGK